MSAILLTGGAGFIGSHLAEHLVSAGERVLLIDNFTDHYSPRIKRHNVEKAVSHPDCTLIETDILDAEAVQALFDENEINRVIHLAARAGVRLLNPLLYEQVNVRGTLNVLEACRKAKIENLLVASSSSVYGNRSEGPFREDDHADRPISPYAATKRSVELHCHTYHHLHGLPISCFRFFTVYGPRQRPDMGFHIFARHIASEKPIRMFGDGSTERDYTFVSDIVEGLTAALSNPQPFEIVNLGNTHTVSLKRALELIQEAMGRKAVIEQMPEQPGDVRRTSSDISKAERLFGFAPKVDIEEGLTRFVEWFQPAWEEGLLKDPF